MDSQYPAEADGSKLREQASTLLEGILGQSCKVVERQWSRVQDPKGRPLDRLTIRDWTGEVFTDFAPDELQNPLHMRFRMHRLWGDLLQRRNDQQHEQVRILTAQMTEGD